MQSDSLPTARPSFNAITFSPNLRDATAAPSPPRHHPPGSTPNKTKEKKTKKKLTPPLRTLPRPNAPTIHRTPPHAAIKLIPDTTSQIPLDPLPRLFRHFIKRRPGRVLRGCERLSTEKDEGEDSDLHMTYQSTAYSDGSEREPYINGVTTGSLTYQRQPGQRLACSLSHQPIERRLGTV